MLKIITFHFLYSYYMLIYGHFPKDIIPAMSPYLGASRCALWPLVRSWRPRWWWTWQDHIPRRSPPWRWTRCQMTWPSPPGPCDRRWPQRLDTMAILIYGGFHKWDYTSWMVYNLENPTEIFWFVLIYFGICWSLMILGVHMFLSLDVLLFMCFPHVLSCVSPFVFVLPPFWWLFEFVSIEFSRFPYFVHLCSFFLPASSPTVSVYPANDCHEWTTVGWHYFYRCSLILLHGFPFLLRDVPFLSISPMVNGSSGDIRVS